MKPHWLIPPNGLIEPAPAPEFYTDGCGAIEMFGVCVRFHLYSEQMPLEYVGGLPQKIVVVKIVRPIKMLPRTLIQITKCLWPDDPPCMRPDGGKPHLVR